MNKILASLLMIGLVIGIAGAGTWAYFSDTESVNENTFTAGTLDLKISNLDDESTTKLPFEIENVKPGDSGSEKAKLKNEGNVAGTVYVKISNIVNDEHGLTAPESAMGDTTVTGELGANLNVVIKVGSGPILYSGPVNSFGSAYKIDGTLNGGESKDLTIDWSVPTSVGNVIQSDKLKFDVNVVLVQVGGPAP